MHPRTRHKARSFTLIETIAAVVILAVAIPPMMMAIREAHDRRIDPVLASRARWLASSRLEDVIADRHSESGDRGYAWLDPAHYPDEAPGDIPGFEQFSRTVTLDETGPPPAFGSGTGYMHVTVTVGWLDSHGETARLAVTTVLTEYTP